MSQKRAKVTPGRRLAAVRRCCASRHISEFCTTRNRYATAFIAIIPSSALFSLALAGT